MRVVTIVTYLGGALLMLFPVAFSPDPATRVVAALAVATGIVGALFQIVFPLQSVNRSHSRR